jgi:hypothetical protein
MGLRVRRRSAAESPDSLELDEAIAPEVDRPLPIAEWFQIEVFHRTGVDDSGRLTVWLNGEQVFDLVGPNSQTEHAEWMIGGVVDALTTPAAELYIDDAAITRRRIGPLPAFTRE